MLASRSLNEAAWPLSAVPLHPSLLTVAYGDLASSALVSCVDVNASSLLMRRMRKAKNNGLSPGEEIVVACAASPSGTFKKAYAKGAVAGSVGPGAAAAWVTHTVDKRIDSQSPAEIASPLASVFPTTDAYIAVTPHRVVVYDGKDFTLWRRGGTPVAMYERGVVRVSNVDHGKLYSALTLAFADGGTIVVEVGTGVGGYDVAGLASALNT